MKRYGLFVFLFLCPLLLKSQMAFNLYSANSGQEAVLNKVSRSAKLPKQVVDSPAGVKACQNFLISLYDNGYLAASFDSIYIKDGRFNAFLNIGQQYKWASLTTSINKSIFNEAGIRLSLENKKPVSSSAISTIVKRLLVWYNENGYPYAIVQLQRIEINEDQLSADLAVDEGPLFRIDTLVIKGSAKISVVYLSSYLSLKKDDLFNESRINKIGTRLKELPFVSEFKKSEVEFSENKARTIIYIDNKKASQFNGIIGVLPDGDKKGKVNVTGDIRLRLLNSFGHAELIDINWSNPQPKSQDLKVKLNYPFLFDTPFGLDLQLSLYKKDTTFLEFDRELGLQYYFQGNNFIKVYAGRKSSDLITVSGYQDVTTLPPYADVTTNTYGLGGKIEHLDYRYNPRSGYTFELQAGAGNKVITRNSKINETAYDSVDLKTTSYNGKGTADIYLPLSQRAVVNVGAIGAWLYSPDIFENELYRFGGLKTLRGFDELSILASQLMIGKIELRYILEQNSYLALFANGAYYENHSNGNFIHDTPFGFGAGMTFETKLGIFSFNYALGKQFDNPILFRAGKIHFGLVNYF